MKKLFNKVDLTWSKVIIGAIIGIYAEFKKAGKTEFILESSKW